MQFDVVITGGRIIDGDAAQPVVADVGIVGERIAAVGTLEQASAATRIDAAGRIVAPGFIDAHTHADLAALLPSSEESLRLAPLRQGVTSQVVGNCGFSPYPTGLRGKDELESYMKAILGDASLTWSDLATFRDVASGLGIVGDLVPLIGHGSLRTVAAEPSSGLRLSAEAYSSMERMTVRALEDGAFGLSSGLIYAPGCFAGSDELVALCRQAAFYGRPYVTHLRDETDGLVAALNEAIDIARRSGAALHVSHHKVGGRSNWGGSNDTLAIIDAARASGIDVTMDAYPYTSGSTLLQALLPTWAQQGSLDEILGRLGDQGTRRRISDEFVEGPAGWQNLVRAAGWSGIRLASCPGAPELEGLTLDELADRASMRPDDYLFDLLVEQRSDVTMILDLMSEDDMYSIVAHPATMIGSDGIPLPGKPHPRVAGTFPRVLSAAFRDRVGLDLATVVAKCTTMVADRFGLDDRGRLSPGLLADIVVFDPDVVADHASYAAPVTAPTGIDYVLTHGKVAVAEGVALGHRHVGQVLAAG